jgi:PAS domain S-box-containing protein
VTEKQLNNPTVPLADMGAASGASPGAERPPSPSGPDPSVSLLRGAERSPTTDGSAARFLDAIPDAVITLDRKFRIVYVNAEAVRINKKPAEAFLGRTHWEEWPASVGTPVEAAYRRVMHTRMSEAFEHRYCVPGIYDVWLAIGVYPADERDGGGIHFIYRDVTERVHREQRERFLAALAERARTLTDPDDVIADAVRSVGEFLHVSRCAFADIDLEADTCRVPFDYCAHRSVPSIVGVFPISAFGPFLASEFQAGRAVAVDDVRADPVRVPPSNVAAYEGIGARGFIAVPAVYSARTQSVIAVHNAEARPWLPEEVDLLRTVVERTWLTVEVARQRRAVQEELERGREREEYLRRLIESSPDCIKTLDLEGTILSINDGGLRLIEVEDAATVCGTNWENLFSSHRETVAGYRAAREAALAGGAGRFLGYCPTPSGRSKWWDVVVVPIVDADGRPERLLAVSRDVTEQRRAADALRMSEAQLKEARGRLEAALSAGEIAAWTYDIVNDRVVADANLAALYGVSSEEVNGGHLQAYLQAIHPSDRSRANAAFRRSVQSGEGGGQFDAEYRVIRPDGSHRWLVSRGRVERDESGRAVSLHGVVLDITPRKAAEEDLRRFAEALQHSGERYRALVDAASQIVWTNSADGRMEGEQPGWSALTGQQFDEYQGFGWSDAVHPDDRQPTIDEWNRCVAERTTFDWEHRVRRRDGVYRRFSIRGVPVLHEDGSIREWVGIHTDVTEQRANEEALRATAERAAVLNRVNRALSESLDPDQIESAAMTILGEALGADRCYMAVFDTAENRAMVACEYRRPETDHLPTVVGCFPLAEFASAAITSHETSEARVVCDALGNGPQVDADGSAAALGLGAYVRIPLYDEGIMDGMLLVGVEDRPRAWTPEEVELIQAVAVQVRAVVKAARIHAELEQDRAKQRRIADTLQESMLLAPLAEGAFPGLEVDAHYEAALDEAQIGGDYGDAFRVDEHRVAILAGDCTGKGLAAARFVAECQFLCRAFLRENPDNPASTLVRLNGVLIDGQRLDQRPESALTTLAVAVIDTRSGIARFTAGGAEPPLIVRARTGRVEEVSVRGALLGVDPRAEYDVVSVPLSPGDVVFLTTDGTTEARNRPARQFFGYEGVTRAVRDAAMADGGRIRGVAREVIRQAKEFAGGALSDDACALAARFTGPTGEASAAA